MGLSVWQILLVLAVVLILFGAGRLPNVMSDVGKGIRNFKDGLNGDKSKKDDDDNNDKKEG